MAVPYFRFGATTYMECGGNAAALAEEKGRDQREGVALIEEIAENGVEDTNNGRGNGSNGEKRGPGIFRQVKDRLNNAAKVRDLKDDLALALNASRSSLRAM